MLFIVSISLERKRETVFSISLQASTYGVVVQTMSREIGDSSISSPFFFNTSQGGEGT